MNDRCLQAMLAGFALVAVLLFAPITNAQDDAAATFKAKCAACHGADGSANTSMGKSMKIRDFHSPDVQKQTDAQLTDIISAGKGAMPAYKGKLSDDQIKQLIGYIRGMGKK
jgi:cytochrome c6